MNLEDKDDQDNGSLYPLLAIGIKFTHIPDISAHP